MESFQKSLSQISVAVVVPAHNEELTIRECIESISVEGLVAEIYVSDNCSTDSTEEIIKAITSSFSSRKVETLLSPVSHFVSSGRWALIESSAEYFCFLAADDLFSSGFVSRSISRLEKEQSFAMTFPSIEWFLGVDPQHRIRASNLGYRFKLFRQAKAFLLPNTSEVANQVYGVFNRAAFETLLSNLEKYGDRFGADYFSVIDTLGIHRSLAIRGTFVFRRVRQGEDLLKRVSFQRKSTSNVILIIVDYVRLHVVINNALASTWSESKKLPMIFCGTVTQLGRFLQIFIEVPIQMYRRIK